MFGVKHNQEDKLRPYLRVGDLFGVIYNNRDKPTDFIVNRVLASAIINSCYYSCFYPYNYVLNIVFNNNNNNNLDWDYIIKHTLNSPRIVSVRHHNRSYDTVNETLSHIKDSADLNDAAFNSKTGEDLITAVNELLIKLFKDWYNFKLNKFDILATSDEAILEVAKSFYKNSTLADIVIASVHIAAVNNAISDTPKTKEKPKTPKMNPLKHISQEELDKLEYSFLYGNSNCLSKEYKDIINKEFSPKLLLDVYNLDKYATIYIHLGTKECALVTSDGSDFNSKFNYTKSIFNSSDDLLNTILINTDYGYKALYNYYCNSVPVDSDVTTFKSADYLKGMVHLFNSKSIGADLIIKGLGFEELRLAAIISPKY